LLPIRYKDFARRGDGKDSEEYMTTELYVAIEKVPPAGGVAAIAWATDEDPLVRVVAQKGSSFTEREVLAAFAGNLAKRFRNPVKPPVTIVHDCDSSVRHIWQRAVIGGVRLPAWWPVGSIESEPFRVYDVSADWDWLADLPSDFDALCHVFAVPGGPQLLPVQVADLAGAGKWGVIGVATQDRVRRLRSVARRQSSIDLLGADVEYLRKAKLASAPQIDRDSAVA
jgi:hypothetical protein